MSRAAAHLGPERHRIAELVFALDIGARCRSLQGPEDLTAAIRRELLPAIESALRSVEATGQDLMLDRIELDLGETPEEPDWPALRRHLHESLVSALMARIDPAALAHVAALPRPEAVAPPTGLRGVADARTMPAAQGVRHEPWAESQPLNEPQAAPDALEMPSSGLGRDALPPGEAAAAPFGGAKMPAKMQREARPDNDGQPVDRPDVPRRIDTDTSAESAASDIPSQQTAGPVLRDADVHDQTENTRGGVDDGAGTGAAHVVPEAAGLRGAGDPGPSVEPAAGIGSGAPLGSDDGEARFGDRDEAPLSTPSPEAGRATDGSATRPDEPGPSGNRAPDMAPARSEPMAPRLDARADSRPDAQARSRPDAETAMDAEAGKGATGERRRDQSRRAGRARGPAADDALGRPSDKNTSASTNHAPISQRAGSGAGEQAAAGTRAPAKGLTGTEASPDGDAATDLVTGAGGLGRPLVEDGPGDPDRAHRDADQADGIGTPDGGVDGAEDAGGIGEPGAVPGTRPVVPADARTAGQAPAPADAVDDRAGGARESIGRSGDRDAARASPDRIAIEAVLAGWDRAELLRLGAALLAARGGEDVGARMELSTMTAPAAGHDGLPARVAELLLTTGHAFARPGGDLAAVADRLGPDPIGSTPGAAVERSGDDAARDVIEGPSKDAGLRRAIPAGETPASPAQPLLPSAADPALVTRLSGRLAEATPFAALGLQEALGLFWSALPATITADARAGGIFLGATARIAGAGAGRAELAALRRAIHDLLAIAATGADRRLAARTALTRMRYAAPVSPRARSLALAALGAVMPGLDNTSPDAATGLVTGVGGLVLFAPYLRMLFDRGGVLDGAGLILADHVPRAHALLAGLSGRDTAQPDPLERVLLGLPPGQPIDLMPIDDELRTLTEGLVRAVIAQWGALGKTSPDGLREAFIRRDGDLILEAGGAARVRVLPGPFDMLLDRLPWSIALIRTPWMPGPLHVRWRGHDDN